MSTTVINDVGNAYLITAMDAYYESIVSKVKEKREKKGKIYLSPSELLDKFEKEANSAPEESKIEEVKSEPKESKMEEVKTESGESKKEEVKIEVKVEPKKEEVKIEVEPEQKITMESRKTCPVKVKSTKSNIKKPVNIKAKVKEKTEEEHRLEHFMNILNNAKVAYTKPIKQPNSLYLMKLLKKDRQQVEISVDIDGLLYSKDIKFFFGRINPGDEYDPRIRPLFMTNEVLDSIVHDKIIDEKFFVPNNFILLNRIVDISSLPEVDSKKREIVLNRVNKMVTDTENYDTIAKSTNGVFRFVFEDYKDPDNFVLSSSNKNLASVLDKNSYLRSKEYKIVVRDKKYVL